MPDNKIDNIIFLRHDVGNAIAALSDEMGRQNLHGALAARLDSVRDDYRLMCDVLCRGLRDEKIDDVYDVLLRRVYAIYADLLTAVDVKRLSSFAYARSAAAACEWHPDTVRVKLEGYVQDMAMASFESDEKRTALAATLRSTHYAYMKSLFAAVLVSGMWSDTSWRDFADILVSPTVDAADSMLVVSAVMLSAMRVFDPYKWLLLVDVYRRATSEELRQRAFVGWVFALPGRQQASLFGGVEAALRDLKADASVRKQLLGLQMQVLFCCNADADDAEIRKDIMPTLLKNSNFKMTRLGIEEKEDDPMDDIVDPDAANRNIEEAEQKFRKMMDMQKAGSDIYFGGFSQMKRFPFFNDMCNWFMPFDMEHPMLNTVREKLSVTESLANMFGRAPFCDSDKYSFALAIASVVDRLPENMREMLGSDMVIGPMASDSERNSGAYVRRSYLQSLYRFFRLYRGRTDFVSPFVLEVGAERSALFFASETLAGDMMTAEVAALGSFLYKRGRYSQLDFLLDNFAYIDDSRLTRLRAMNCMKQGHYNDAYRLLMQLTDADGHADVTRMLAACCFATKRYGEAVTLYRQLVEGDPTHLSYNLNLAVCLMNGDGLDEAARILFRLDYEHPECDNVKRALAWCLMLQGSADKAAEQYRLLLAGAAVAADYLNAGYARWFGGDIAGALQLMRKYCDAAQTEGRKASPDLASDFDNDRALLDKYGIRSSERKIMADLTTRPDGAAE